MWPYIFISMAIAAILTGALDLILGRRNNTVAGVIVAAILQFGLSWLLMYFAMPSFSMFPYDGYTGLAVSIAISAGIGLAVAAGFTEYDGSWAPMGGITVLAVLYFGYVGVLSWTLATEPFPPSEEHDRLKVAPTDALNIARKVIKQPYGSYLEVNNANQVSVQGKRYYVVDLKVTDWRIFRDQGAYIPGYILVDATNPNVPGDFRLGYKIRYSPGASWNLDLQRRAYMDFELPNHVMIDKVDLERMELDENFKPFYTAALSYYTVGTAATIRQGLIVVDPETGEITQYKDEEIPEWVDSATTSELADEHFDLLGQYQAAVTENKAICWKGTAQQEQADRVTDVLTPNGLKYQVTMTSMGKDETFNSLFLYDPRTKTAVKYNITGSTIESLEQLIVNAVEQTDKSGTVPTECEVQNILGRMTLYCILTFKEGGAYKGNAYVPISATNPQQVAWDTSDTKAYNKYRTMRDEATDAPAAGKEVTEIQATGVVIRIGQVPGNPPLVQFSIHSKDVTPDKNFRMSPDFIAVNADAAYLKPGDEVTVTADTTSVDNYLDVKALENKTYRQEQTNPGR